MKGGGNVMGESKKKKGEEGGSVKGLVSPGVGERRERLDCGKEGESGYMKGEKKFAVEERRGGTEWTPARSV